MPGAALAERGAIAIPMVARVNEGLSPRLPEARCVARECGWVPAEVELGRGTGQALSEATPFGAQARLSNGGPAPCRGHGMA